MPDSCQRFFILLFGIVTLALGYAPAQTAVATPPAITLEAVTSSHALPNGIELQAGAATVRITALRDDIVRVRISADGALPEDASWAVLPGPRAKSVDVRMGWIMEGFPLAPR